MIKSLVSSVLLSTSALASSPQVTERGNAVSVLENVKVEVASSVPTWEMSRGEDRLIILSDYFPRRITEDNYVDIDVIEELASGAEALV